jgi:hypothetical protein
MTNEQNAKRLEEMAETFERLGDTAAALLLESAALWREQPGDGWHTEHEQRYRRFVLRVGKTDGGEWYWQALSRYLDTVQASGTAPTLPAAHAAAIAWVDAQEGK